MITLNKETAEAIRIEMESIPEKYWPPFNSSHEGYAIILEEVRELEKEVFFGEKDAKQKYPSDHHTTQFGKDEAKKMQAEYHKKRMKEECIQIAAMCARFIQELT